jgi:hypothetical protein
MTEERDQQQDDVQLPDEAVEDLEPGDEETSDVSGGAFKQGFPMKWSGSS